MNVQVMGNRQITIPLEVWQQLNLREGDELTLKVEGNELRLRPVKKRRLSQFRGVLPATVPYPGKESIRQHIAQSLAES
jgi:AbrB family looped-hinge helix DNA binding protein